MTINGATNRAVLQPGSPTTLTSLVLKDSILDLDKAFLAVLPLKNLQVLYFSCKVITMKQLGQYTPTKFQIALPCLHKLTLCSINTVLHCREFAELIQPDGVSVELDLLCNNVEDLMHAAPNWLRMTKQQTATFGVYCT